MVPTWLGWLSPKGTRHKPVASTCAWEGLSATRPGKGECEARAFPFGAFDSEIALHCPREITAYRQPQTNPALPADERFLQLKEGLEDRFVLFGSNADSRVADQHVDGVVYNCAACADVATGRRELDRIGEEVDQNLSHPRAICPRGDARVSGDAIERNTLLPEERLDQLDGVLDRLARGDIG